MICSSMYYWTVKDTLFYKSNIRLFLIYTKAQLKHKTEQSNEFAYEVLLMVHVLVNKRMHIFFYYSYSWLDLNLNILQNT